MIKCPCGVVVDATAKPKTIYVGSERTSTEVEVRRLCPECREREKAFLRGEFNCPQGQPVPPLKQADGTEV